MSNFSHLIRTRLNATRPRWTTPVPRLKLSMFGFMCLCQIHKVKVDSPFRGYREKEQKPGIILRLLSAYSLGVFVPGCFNSHTSRCGIVLGSAAGSGSEQWKRLKRIRHKDQWLIGMRGEGRASFEWHAEIREQIHHPQTAKMIWPVYLLRKSIGYSTAIEVQECTWSHQTINTA